MTASNTGNKKVLLGLSGGVDSTAAALLLQKKGYEVYGFFFDVLGNQFSQTQEAKFVAEKAGIPFLSRNVKKEFEVNVIHYFCESYACGETPNPCIQCNPTIKFRMMCEEADHIEASFLATGHYANVEQDLTTGIFYVTKAKNEKKDQSYMLYRLPQKILSRLLLPLGDIQDKKETREIVRAKGVGNADAKDSQEICFIKNGNYIDYLTQNGYKATPGNFVDLNGNILGKHQGILYYTIGQRKGLGITFGEPRFVIDINSKNNTVVLGKNEDLFRHEILLTQCILTGLESCTLKEKQEYFLGKQLQGKIRYAAMPTNCKITQITENTMTILFDEPQRAATKGQALVLYDQQRLVGGGTINFAK